MRAEPPAGSLAGHYAGPVTRLSAYAVDAFVIVATYGLMLSLITFVWQLVSRRDLELPASDTLVWLIGLGIWTFLYFAASWGLVAKTVGHGRPRHSRGRAGWRRADGPPGRRAGLGLPAELPHCSASASSASSSGASAGRCTT